MKRQIRRSCFETNSSSMHSLVIKKEDEYVDPKKESENIYIHDGALSMIWNLYFDRVPFEILTSFYDKLRYAIASLCTSDEQFETEFLPIIREILPEVKTVRFGEEQKTYYYDEDGNEVKPEWYGDGLFYVKNGEKKKPIPKARVVGKDYGGVDHQSVGLLQGFLKGEGISLKEFLTNRKYVVIIDGDEYGAWGDVKRSGLINLDKIEREYPPDDEPFDTYEWRNRANEEAD